MPPGFRFAPPNFSDASTEAYWAHIFGVTHIFGIIDANLYYSRSEFGISVVISAGSSFPIRPFPILRSSNGRDAHSPFARFLNS